MSIPPTGKKNEYHKRVSPIVLSGGRQVKSITPAINTANIIKPAVASSWQSFALLLYTKAAPPIQNSTEPIGEHINESQVILYYYVNHILQTSILLGSCNKINNALP